MIKAIASAFFLLSLLHVGPAAAESCDAGHGCSITCTDGCSAIYNLDTGRCSKACGKALSASQMKEKRGHLNATFRDAPRTDIEKVLKSVK
jgi:hypothetical protein